MQPDAMLLRLRGDMTWFGRMFHWFRCWGERTGEIGYPVPTDKHNRPQMALTGHFIRRCVVCGERFSDSRRDVVPDRMKAKWADDWEDPRFYGYGQDGKL